MFGHRFLGLGDSEGQGWVGQTVGGQVLCPVDLSCGKGCGQRKNREIPLESSAQCGVLFAQVLRVVLCMPLNRIKRSVP